MEELINSDKFVNLLGEESVQSIRCSICLDYFQRPVILVCGHTFCFSCIKDTADHVLAMNPSRPPWHVYLNCPHCRKPTNAYQTSQSHVPVNYTVASLVHALKQINIPSTNSVSTNTDNKKDTVDSQTETENIIHEHCRYDFDVEKLDTIETDIENMFATTDRIVNNNIIDHTKKEIENIRKTTTSQNIIELEREALAAGQAYRSREPLIAANYNYYQKYASCFPQLATHDNMISSAYKYKMDLSTGQTRAENREGNLSLRMNEVEEQDSAIIWS